MQLFQAQYHGGGGGWWQGGQFPMNLQKKFFCLLAQRSVMSMMMMPLPHYDNFLGKILSRKKNVSEFFVFVLCLSAQRSVMSMMVPLPHYKFGGKIMKSEKNVSESPPPPPTHTHTHTLSDLFQGSRSSSKAFCPP